MTGFDDQESDVDSISLGSSDAQPKRKKSSLVIWVASLIVIAMVGTAGWVGYNWLRDVVAGMSIEDYSGQPGPEVEIVISEGDTGEDVARKLVEADVIKSFDAIYRPMLASEFIVYPGTYRLPTKLSGVAALNLLISGEARYVRKVTIQEGLRASRIFELLSTELEIPIGDLEKAAKDLNALGIPDSAPSIEGYLFPATYEFDPGVGAKEVIQTLTNRMLDELIDLGVAESDWHEVLTMASIVQVEGKPRDFGKVARVFFNRLDLDMALQSDATVSYATNGETVTTTDEQRATDSPYNTYYYRGLPIGPINSPGSEAIRATLAPEAGEWLYFVTINLETGETAFTNSYAEHLVEVEKFQAWIRANPEWND